MAWRIVCELLLLSKFVSLSVIPENRKLNELTKSQRTKRSIDSFYSDDDDDDVETVEHWDSLCEALPHRRVLAKEKHNGKLIFKLAPHLGESRNINYLQFVTEWQCVNPEAIFSRGGERFKCVQQRVRHEVDVYDEDTVPATMLFTKTFFINSGCEAKILT